MHVPLTEVILCHAGTELARATLAPGEYVIGREAGVDLRADTPLLSRRHARLTINYDHLLLEDLASSNGTFINDRPLAEPTRLFPNQSVRLGPDITLEVRRQRASAEPAVSLAPAQAAIARHLPAELLAEKRYAIGGVVAQGGMGAILDARQRAIDRTVAMKVMLATGDEADVLRFIDEAKITGQLDHPNIVPIYELGVDEQDQLFYTMKMVRGVTLKQVLADLATGDDAALKKYPLPVLLTVFQKVCDALAFAHAKGVIHRDLKPENLMLGDFGSVLVMDWGLAKVLDQKNAPGADVTRSGVVSARSAEPEVSATMTGSIMGTPAYMSPEQARGEIETLDARSDIYALGAILFEILHLRPAVTGTAAMEIVGKVARGEVAWDAKKSTRVPDSLLAITRKTLALAPAARYRSVEAIQADLLAYQNGFATSAEKAGLGKQFALLIKRHKAAAIGAAAVLIVGAGLGSKAVVEGRRANRTLASMRATAPLLVAETRRLIDSQKFDEALGKIRFACEIEPRNANYRLLLAQLLQARLELTPAAEEFRRLLGLGPNDSASTNLALCERLLRDYPPPAALDHSAIHALEQQMEKEGRLTQAAPLTMKLGESKRAIDAILQARLIAWRKIPGWDKAPESDRVRWEPDGTLSIFFSQLKIDDLSTLQGLPIYQLWLQDMPVSDLRPLSGMRLTKILLRYLKNLRDLSPLKGMPLESFDSEGLPKPTDLSPLTGMKLKELHISHGSYPDLSPFRGMALSKLVTDDNKLTNLADFAGAPITDLVLVGCKELRDISILRKMPLKHLEIESSANLRDFTPLLDCSALEKVSVPRGVKEIEVLRHHPTIKALSYDTWSEGWTPTREFWENYDDPQGQQSRKLTRILATRSKAVGDGTIELDCSRESLSDLTILKDLKVSRLNLSNNPITDLSALRGMPLRSLSLATTPIKDLSPLRGLPLKRLHFDQTKVVDVSPLLDLLELEDVMLPETVKNLEILRPHPKIKYLGWQKDWIDGRSRLTAAEFWARYDAQQAAGKK